MLSIKIYISCFILCSIIVQIKSLVELPDVEDNNIGVSETAIRNTVNKIFVLFKIQDVKHKPRLKQYSTIHNFFVSITLTDGNNLKEIARLTRVNNIDNNTQHFITQINEVLNEDDKSYDSNDTNNLNVTKYIGMFIRKLKFLKERYVSNRNTVINTDILKYLVIDEKPLTNETEINNISVTNDTEENTLIDNEFWQTSGRRIFQGIRTTIKTFPFMASVLFFKRFQCAGSIIKNDLVITSASCLQLAWNNRFFRENPAFLSVQVGSDVYEGGGDNIGVIELYFYPKYDPKTLRNNLAIMRLTRKIAFKEKQKRVKKIDFDKNPWPMPINSPPITVVGWGAKDSSNIISDPLTNKLSYAELDYYPLIDCQEHYSVDFVTEKNFCAGFMSKGSGACNRDAGGPGIIDNTLYGVISFGSPICGAPDAPTVFTKLGFYVDWIETIMEQPVATKFGITTTNAPDTLFDFPIKEQTKTTMHIDPIGKTTTGSTLGPNHLRIVQDQGFKDFLATMFSNDDIKEYFDKSLDNTNEENNNSGGSDFEEKLKKPLINENQQNIKRKVTKSKRKHTTIPTTTAKTVESSDEFKSDKEQDTGAITESERQVTVLENVSEEKNLEEDIMTLIDNLDIDTILKPNLPEETHNKEKKKAKSNKIFKKKEKGLNVASSQSGENHVNISPKQQSVLNFIFLSEENKDEKKGDDEGGLSIDADHFKDLTFRDRPLRSNATKHDVLSETALYELISLAIDEEAKRLRKGKRYTL